MSQTRLESIPEEVEVEEEQSSELPTELVELVESVKKLPSERKSPEKRVTKVGESVGKPMELLSLRSFSGGEEKLDISGVIAKTGAFLSDFFGDCNNRNPMIVLTSSTISPSKNHVVSTGNIVSFDTQRSSVTGVTANSKPVILKAYFKVKDSLKELSSKTSIAGVDYENKIYDYINTFIPPRVSCHFARKIFSLKCGMDAMKNYYTPSDVEEIIKNVFDQTDVPPSDFDADSLQFNAFAINHISDGSYYNFPGKILPITELYGILGKLSDEELNNLMFQLCYALEAMASVKLLHNDLHKRNVMVVQLPEVCKLRFDIYGDIYVIQTQYIPVIFDWDFGATEALGPNPYTRDEYPTIFYEQKFVEKRDLQVLVCTTEYNLPYTESYITNLSNHYTVMRDTIRVDNRLLSRLINESMVIHNNYLMMLPSSLQLITDLEFPGVEPVLLKYLGSSRGKLSLQEIPYVHNDPKFNRLIDTLEVRDTGDHYVYKLPGSEVGKLSPEQQKFFAGDYDHVWIMYLILPGKNGKVYNLVTLYFAYECRSMPIDRSSLTPLEIIKKHYQSSRSEGVASELGLHMTFKLN